MNFKLAEIFPALLSSSALSIPVYFKKRRVLGHTNKMQRLKKSSDRTKQNALQYTFVNFTLFKNLKFQSNVSTSHGL